ncbi:MAG: O-antigen ligase family protein [Pirellulaceae bacterium]|nr:O-antigen ligase family protein [Pirellulaceae bacterium]
MRASRHKKPPAERTASALAVPDRSRRLDDWLLAGATALIVATPLVPSEATIPFGAAAPLHLLWVLLLIGWLLAGLLRPEPRIRLGWTALAAAALIGWHTLAALTAGLEGHGRHALNSLWQWIGYGLAGLLLLQLLRGAADCRALVAVLISLAAAEAAHGGYEYFVSQPAQLAEFERDPPAAFRAAGVTSEVQQQQFRWRLEAKEPLGTFALTNSLAGLIAPWLMALLGIALASLGGPELRKTLLGSLAIALVLGGCLLLTKSRTALLAVGGGVGLLAIYGRGESSRLAAWIDWKLLAGAAAVAVLLALGVVGLGGLDIEVLSEAPLSVRYRVEYWRATAAMIAEHPLLGCGPGNFQTCYTRYKLPQASETVGDPHNFLLEVWATAGTPALLALLAVGAAFTWELARRKTPAIDPPAEPSANPWPIYAGALAGLLLGYPLGALVGYPPPQLTWLPLPVIWVIGLPIAAFAVWLLDPWVRRGSLPLAVPVLALVVLLVNLLAAGAASFPGVFLGVWVLIPVALVVARSPVWNWRLTRPMLLAHLATALALLTLIVRTEVNPVLTASARQLLATEAISAGNQAQAEADLLAAAAADRWSPEPWRMLAELRAQVHAQTGNPADYDRFAAAAEEFRRRDPHHDRQFESRGHWLLLAWRKTGRSELLEEAIEAYHAAAEWHPALALHQAQLAWTLHLAGESAAATAAAERALALDAVNPHAELKLARQRVYDPEDGPGNRPPFRPEDAEQTARRLRTNSGPEKSP